ncbi:MAG: STAS domain-containing protein, partial [Thermoleophilia bacterium]|nr:STAS domain-containing protein [Thermoleophilia bacterium]
MTAAPAFPPAASPPSAGRAWAITRSERLDRRTAILAVEGEFDRHTYAAATAVLRRLEGRGARVVVVDLLDLDFMGGSGVRLLAEAQERAGGGGWQLVVVAPRPPADRVLRLVEGLESRLNLARR